jgi:hypothetical protein
MIEKDGMIQYSWFEIEMVQILQAGPFSRTTEPYHKNKALWDEVQRLKKLARSETPEMAGED